MARRVRRLAVALLVLAALIGTSTALLSNLIVSYSTDELPGEGVTVKYVSVNPAVPSFIVRLPEPRIHVTDLAGKRIAGIIVNVFAGMPRARVKYLGRVAGRGDSAALTPTVLGRFRASVVPEWRSALGSTRGFKAALLTFIDVLIPAGRNSFKVYSFVKTVPVNLGLISAGYRIASIDVTVNTAAVKPTEVLNMSRVKTTSTAPISRQGLSAEGPSDCISFCADLACSCFCTEWRLEKTYAHIENKLIPIVAVKISRGYYTTPQTVSMVFESFSFKDTEVSWFKLYAAAKITGNPHVELMDWESYTKFNFFYSKAFYNSRWINEKPSFRDDAIVAIGFAGSATLGEFRKYEATCECSFCSESDYHPTDTTANITFIDISAKYTGSTWEAASYGYIIDDVLGDGNGFEKFWNLMISHSEIADSKSGTGEVRYQFQGYINNEVDMGVDVVGLLSFFVEESASKLAKHFPVDAGIGWGVGEKIVNNVEIYVQNHYEYNNYYMFLTNYECKDKVFIGNDEVQLKLMYFNINVYPPSGV